MSIDDININNVKFILLYLINQIIPDNLYWKKLPDKENSLKPFSKVSEDGHILAEFYTDPSGQKLYLIQDNQFCEINHPLILWKLTKNPKILQVGLVNLAAFNPEIKNAIDRLDFTKILTPSPNLSDLEIDIVKLGEKLNNMIQNNGFFRISNREWHGSLESDILFADVNEISIDVPGTAFLSWIDGDAKLNEVYVIPELTSYQVAYFEPPDWTEEAEEYWGVTELVYFTYDYQTDEYQIQIEPGDSDILKEFWAPDPDYLY